MTITESDWYRLPAWTRHLLTILDEHLNEKTGGDPGTTLSYRAAKAREAGHVEGIMACRILDRINPGHCDRALKAGR
jgi:hypothetical protein